jgi:hypothetical protein
MLLLIHLILQVLNLHLSLLQHCQLALHLLNPHGLFIRCSFKLFCFEFVLHHLQFELILTVLQVDSLVQFVLCSFCLLLVLFFQLYVLFFVNFGFDQFVPVKGVNILWQVSHVSLALSIAVYCGFGRDDS